MAGFETMNESGNIYDILDDIEALPLYIRYTEGNIGFNYKNSSTSFKDIAAELSGIQMCHFIHRKQKGRGNEYDVLEVKIDGQPYCMTVQNSRDGYTLRSPSFSQKNMILPENKELFIDRKCKLEFVDSNVDAINLFNNYWLTHKEEIKNFIKECFELTIPPIEIQVEEEKDMWKSYIEGMTAILKEKKETIKIKSYKRNEKSLQIEIDTVSYAQNLKDEILKTLQEGNYDKSDVEIRKGECLITINEYQWIPPYLIEEIKNIGLDNCYKAKSCP